MKYGLVASVIFICFHANAYKSAYRHPNESWTQAHRRSLVEYKKIYNKAPPENNAQEAAVKIDKLDNSILTAWDKSVDLVVEFTGLRDIRFLETKENPGFLRRISWQYPDDGCFARAAMSINRFNEWKRTPPSKVFIFGDLSVHTPNAPDGKVNWWYHVAPIVNYAGQAYVLDAAISPQKPLPIIDWLQTMTNDIQSVNVAYCHSNTYIPSDSCLNPTAESSNNALSDQMQYLWYEWNRAKELGRDPNKSLGVDPPWKNQGKIF